MRITDGILKTSHIVVSKQLYRRSWWWLTFTISSWLAVEFSRLELGDNKVYILRGSLRFATVYGICHHI